MLNLGIWLFVLAKTHKVGGREIGEEGNGECRVLVGFGKVDRPPRKTNLQELTINPRQGRTK